MNTIRVARRIALTIISVAAFNVPRCISAATGREGFATSGTSAREAIQGALNNVRSRYRNTLDYYGLEEWYYKETNGICSLKLVPHGRVVYLWIYYFRGNDTIEYPQMMPKGLAQRLISDRMMIDSYEMVLRADEINKTRSKPTQQKETGRPECEAGGDAMKKTTKRSANGSGMRRRPRQNRSGWGTDSDRELTSADIEAQMHPENSWREREMKLFDRYKPNKTPSTWADDNTGANGTKATKGNSSSHSGYLGCQGKAFSAKRQAENEKKRSVK